MNAEDQANQVISRLRKRGFVVYVDDMAPRPWSAANFRPKAVLLHHTASTSVTSLTNEASDVRVIKSVSWGPPGAQWYVGRTGRICCICKGGANHAGTGGGLVDHGIGQDIGNYLMWGIENQSAGLRQDWTQDEWLACHALTGELLTAMNEPVHQVWRHKDYDDDSGKIDTQYPLDEHREAVRDYLEGKVNEMTGDEWKRLGEMLDKKIADGVKKGVDDALHGDVTDPGDTPKVSYRTAIRGIYRKVVG